MMSLTPFEVQSAARTEVEDRPPNDLTPAQKRGLKYQAKVEVELKRLYSERVLFRPWFRYRIDWRHKICQPDAIIFESNWKTAIVVEIKYSTVPEAWDKLNTLYRPVVEKSYRIPVYCTLVTRRFDPHISFGECAIEQLEGLEHLASFREKGLGVVSWR